MRLLLDTHTAIWVTGISGRIPPRVRGIVRDPSNQVFVSVVSLWEIAIKSRLPRKTNLPVSAERANELFTAVGLHVLSVEIRHALAVETLPALHGDPFDRLIVAQALAEPLRLVTHDRQVAAYSDTVILF